MSDVTAEAMTASRASGAAADARQVPQPGRSRGSARQSTMLSSSRAGEVNRARVLKTLYANNRGTGSVTVKPVPNAVCEP